MKVGAHAQWLIDVHEEKGLPPPPEVEAPPLFEGAEEYLNAFWLLSECRTSSGMGGINPIPLAEIYAFFQIYGIDDITDKEDYIRFVKALDSTYLKYEYEKLDRKRKREQAQAKAGKR